MNFKKDSRKFSKPVQVIVSFASYDISKKLDKISEWIFRGI